MPDQIKKVEQFYKYDLRIKDSMLDIAPKPEYQFQEKKYRNLILNAVKIYKVYLIDMIRCLNLGDDYIDMISIKLDNMIDYLSQDLHYTALRDFYKNFIADMNKDLIDSVNTECKGHYLLNNAYGLLKKSKTINEMLHVLHSYLLNHEQLYDRMPVIEEDREGIKYIRLTGVDNEISRAVYTSVSNGIDSNMIDILSLEDRMIMMFRDLGHALSIEIEYDIDRNYARVNYFIPKVCNIDMIKVLKGIRNYNEKYAKGSFETTVDDLVSDLYGFLRKVPTDADMPSFNGQYRKENQSKAM